MTLEKALKDDERGFIFTVDGTLAVLISILGLAAVLAVGSPTTAFRQHGYRRLGDYANDALQVMEVGGTLDEIENLVRENQKEMAKNYARNKLLEILPDGIQFRMEIGTESNLLEDNIYPTSSNTDIWRERYENAVDVASSIQISTINNEFEPIILYVWRGEGL